MVYQFIFTTDKKLTIGYPIPDRISDGYIIWDRISYHRLYIPGSHLEWNIYSRIKNVPGNFNLAPVEVAFMCTRIKQVGQHVHKSHTICEYKFQVSSCDGGMIASCMPRNFMGDQLMCIVCPGILWVVCMKSISFSWVKVPKLKLRGRCAFLG